MACKTKKKQLGGPNEGKLYVLGYEPGYDDTFRKEYERAGQAAIKKGFPGLTPEYITVKEGELPKVLASLPDSPNIMIMDHAGFQMFGFPTGEFIDMLVEKNPKVCIGGSCSSASRLKELKEKLPDSEVFLDNDAWTGFDLSKSGMEAVIADNEVNGPNARDRQRSLETQRRYEEQADLVRRQMEAMGINNRRRQLGGAFGNLLGGISPLLNSQQFEDFFTTDDGVTMDNAMMMGLTSGSPFNMLGFARAMHNDDPTKYTDSFARGTYGTTSGGVNISNREMARGIQDQLASLFSLFNFQEGGPVNQPMSMEEFLHENPMQYEEPIPDLPMTYEMARVEDPRTKRATTKQKINPNRDLVSGDYDVDLIKHIVASAKRHDVDPYTALAVAMAESNLGKTTPGNVFHTLNVKTNEKTIPGTHGDIEEGISTLKSKLKRGEEIFGNDEAKVIQTYNGLGKIKPNTESDYHGFEMKGAYGVPMDEKGIDLVENPLYGINVIDIRDNVLKKNDVIKDIVDEVDDEYINTYETYYTNRQRNARLRWDSSLPQTTLDTRQRQRLTLPPPDSMMYGGRVKKYQVGGSVITLDRVQRLLEKNRNLDFVKRIFDAGDAKPLKSKKGEDMTHRMAAETDGKGNWYVIPTIVNKNGKLVPFDNNQEALDYALKNGEYIKTDKSTAMWMAENGYKAAAQSMKRIRKYQAGGTTDDRGGGDMVSIMGYRRDSPFNTAPFLMIDGNVIDMSETDRDLILIPDKGTPRMAKGGSGTYEFPEATKVLEIPTKPSFRQAIMKYGGKVKKYQLGGGVLPFEPIQTEKGELFVFPNMMISPVNASELHEDMDEDLVTDVVPQGSFVGSDDPRRIITRSEAENISFGYKPQLYKEGKKGKPVEEVTLADIILKDGETSIYESEAIERIRTKYSITDHEQDKFSDLAIQENKQSRAMFLQAIAYLNKQKASEEVEEGEVELFRKGGYAGRRDGEDTFAVPAFVDKGLDAGTEPMKAQVDPFSLIAGAAGGLFDVIGGVIQNKQAKKQYERSMAEINAGAGVQRNLAGTGALFNVASVLGQDPVATRRDFSDERRRLESLPTEVPQEAIRMGIDRVAAGDAASEQRIFEETGNFARAANTVGNIRARSNKSAFDMVLDSIMQDLNLETGRTTNLANLEGRISGARFGEGETTRAGVNAVTSGVGAAGTGYTNAMSTIEGNRVSNSLAASGALFSGQQQAMQNIFGGLGNAAGSTAAYFANQNGQSTQPVTTQGLSTNSTSGLAPGSNVSYEINPITGKLELVGYDANGNRIVIDTD